jgi:hypothetical protein
VILSAKRTRQETLHTKEHMMDPEIQTPPQTDPGEWTAEQIAAARADIFRQIENETRQDRARQQTKRDTPRQTRKRED